MKKLIYGALALIGGGGVIFTTLTATETENNGNPSFAQYPPLPKHYYIQKIENAEQGQPNLKLAIEMVRDEDLPSEIPIYRAGVQIFTLKDDGEYPDQVANDMKYTTYLNLDINDFETEISARLSTLHTRQIAFKNRGHDVETIKTDAANLSFDFENFSGFHEVEIEPVLLNVADCGTNLKKENSLFITDLSVVEDPGRTYQIGYTKIINPQNASLNQWVPANGNPQGAWTFGQLMKNAANPTMTGISVHDFIRHWINVLGSEQNVPAGNAGTRVLPGRFVMPIIIPWIFRAKQLADPLYWQNHNFPQNVANGNGGYFSGLQDGNTEYVNMWNSIPENDLLATAPFKLMAIVNRLDLRANFSYSPGSNNSGETRFIFTLLDTTGKPPVHRNHSFTMQPSEVLDWQGMNVIFEYKNPMTTLCQTQGFAQQWYDLSGLALGSNDYLEQLENITNMVTLPGSALSPLPNGSLLARIRTNEKVLDLNDPTPQQCGASPNGQDCWQPASWQLRQFEIDPNTKMLESRLVTNTPVNDEFNNTVFGQLDNGESNLNDYNGGYTDVLNWVYNTLTPAQRAHIADGNFNLPDELLGPNAILHQESAEFYGYDMSSIVPATDNPDIDFSNDPFYIQAKEIRHQLSLNTCQGCHAGENKTMFTQVRPVGYGVPATYWNTTPDCIEGSFDLRFSTEEGTNNEKTFDNYLQSLANQPNLPNPPSPHVDNFYLPDINTSLKKQIVSPFITGRIYRQFTDPITSQPIDNWDDDEQDENANLAKDAIENSFPSELEDKSLTGYFYVNDPSNNSWSLTLNSQIITPGKGGSFPQLHYKRYKYNELEMRKQDMCRLLQQNCVTHTFPTAGTITSTISISDVNVFFNILHGIDFIPLPLGGH